MTFRDKKCRSLDIKWFYQFWLLDDNVQYLDWLCWLSDESLRCSTATNQTLSKAIHLICCYVTVDDADAQKAHADIVAVFYHDSIVNDLLKHVVSNWVVCRQIATLYCKLTPSPVWYKRPVYISFVLCRSRYSRSMEGGARVEHLQFLYKTSCISKNWCARGSSVRR